jgi:phospholipid-binding lipoprotein MlaA
LRLLTSAVLVAGLLHVTGCSTVPVAGPVVEPPMRKYNPPVGAKPLLVVEDPWEGFNRRSYIFNYYFDEYLFLPVVRTYEFILPDYAQDRVSCFVENVAEVRNLFNNLLSLNFKAAGITLGRFALNTTVGVVGLWDRASQWGIKRQREELGDTLAHYGVGPGAYLVLPVLGPSSARDAVGFAGDTAFFATLGPGGWIDDDPVELGYAGVAGVDTRHRVPFRYQRTGSPFEYELVRMLYSIKREMDTRD